MHIWLAIAGALVVCGVIAYNAWLTRRRTPRPPHGDASDETLPRIEPQLHTDDDGAAELAAAMAVDSEEALARAAAAPQRSNLPLDALIDAIVPIDLGGRALRGEALLSVLPATRRVGNKPFAVEGCNEASGAWERPAAGQRYNAVQAGVQLANRKGALSQIDFSDFVAVAQRLADSLHGEAEIPDMRSEVARARELDQFASACDAQLAFNVHARGALWSTGFVRQCAGRLGFTAAVPGSMVLPGESGQPPLLTLEFSRQAALSDDPQQAAVSRVTLRLDVPQVDSALQPFARLCESARALAEAMDGVLCDEAGQELREEFIAGIRDELNALYLELERHGLPAGSPQARRLFSD